MQKLIFLLIVSALLLLSACGDWSLDERGGAGQPCFNKGECHSGLTCTQGVCRSASQECEGEAVSCDSSWTRACQNGAWVRLVNCSEKGEACAGGACVAPQDGDESEAEYEADNDADNPEREVENEAEAVPGDGDLEQDADDTDREGESEPESDQTDLEPDLDDHCTSGPCCANGHWLAVGQACLSDADAFACTTDLCDASHACIHTRLADKCLLGAVCYDQQQGKPGMSCMWCNATNNTWEDKPASEACDDGNACTYGEHCDGSGACGAGTTLSCTNATDACGARQACAGTSTCATSYPNAETACETDNLACTDDFCDGAGACGHNRKAGFCLIDGVCAADGAANPSNECQVCNATANAWAAKATTESCAADALSCTNDHCNGSGSCVHERKTGFCLISGECYANNTDMLLNACRYCDAYNTPTDWRAKASGTSCGSPTVTTCTDRDTCTSDGECLVNDAPNTKTCDDGNACTFADTCDGKGGCLGTAFSCNGHGSCNGNNTCACDPYFGGARCDQCSADGAGYPNCTERVIKIAAGYGHACALLFHGGMKCWGDNTYGQLGNGASGASLYEPGPVQVSGLTSGVIDIATGGYHSCALLSGGAMKCWGYNNKNQIGDGNGGGSSTQTTPAQVSGLASGVTAMATGSQHTCALLSGGAMKCWGDNNSGQLGTNGGGGYNVPTQVYGFTSGVTAISAGYNHTCAILTGGSLMCWGSNGSYQIGDGSGSDKLKPIQVTGLTSGVLAVAAGASHTCAILSGGALKCWGENYAGQLGNGSTTDISTPTAVSSLSSGVATIAACISHTCAILADGSAKCWGDNTYGELGDGTKTNATSPVQVSGLTSGVGSLSGGNGFTCALMTSGVAKCWGTNDKGQLGIGSLGAGQYSSSAKPVPVLGLGSGNLAVDAGSLHTCAVLASGAVNCWGRNAYGQIGDGTTGNGYDGANKSSPTQVIGLTGGMAAIALGENHSCALSATGGMKCWGYNGAGRLGNASTSDALTPVQVIGLENGVSSIAAGSYHSCAVLAGGGVKCWGLNDRGQLGDGTSGTGTDKTIPTQVYGLTSGVSMIAAGEYHTCALMTDGSAKCWGRNAYGQLGDGTTDLKTIPTQVSGLTSGVIAIAAGQNHTCALLSTGELRCWGFNDAGQLGVGGTTNQNTPVQVSGMASGVTAVSAGTGTTCAIVTGGGVKCWPWDGNTTPTAVNGLASGVANISVGGSHVCVRLTDGTIKCWGTNSYGQLGTGDPWRTTPTDVVW